MVELSPAAIPLCSLDTTDSEAVCVAGPAMPSHWGLNTSATAPGWRQRLNSTDDSDGS